MADETGAASRQPGAAAVVVAGGTGERFGRDGGKQLVEVAGRPVLWWSVRACAYASSVSLIVLVCPSEAAERYTAVAAEAVPEGMPLLVAASGATRQKSVSAGIALVPQETRTVIVHDGARPLLLSALVEELVAYLNSREGIDGVVVGHPSFDTLKVVEDGEVIETPDRSRFWAVQTPQVFRADALRDAHRLAAAEGFSGTDDASLLERAGFRVGVMQGPRDNVKVTVAEDLAYVEAVLRRRREGVDG